MNTATLKKAADAVIAAANAQGVDLREIFKSREDFQQHIIGLCIKTLIDAGLPVDKAMDQILGKNTYANLSEQIYNELTA